MNSPDHAFVVMAHGDSPFLAGCLNSLADQTVRSRVMITTSTPSDFIKKAAKAAGVPLIINPYREGIAADWNFALQASKARWVTLAHQDDVYYPAFAERSLALLDTGADLSFTGYVEIDDHGAPRGSKIAMTKHTLELLTLGAARRPGRRRMRAFLSFGNPLPCSSVTFDVERLWEFTFTDTYRSNLDWDAWLTLADAGVAFARTPERLVGRRHNPLTATASLIREGVRQSEDVQMFRRLWPRPLADLIGFAYRAGYS